MTNTHKNLLNVSFEKNSTSQTLNILTQLEVLDWSISLKLPQKWQIDINPLVPEFFFSGHSLR